LLFKVIQFYLSCAIYAHIKVNFYADVSERLDALKLYSLWKRTNIILQKVKGACRRQEIKRKSEESEGAL